MMSVWQVFRRPRLVAALAFMLSGLAGCSAVHPVSSFHSTNLEGAPGSADDVTTGGQGSSAHGDTAD